MSGNAWQAEQDRKHEITRQVAGTVTTELGAGWKVDTAGAEGANMIHADGPDGARIGFMLDWRDADRLEIHGTYPDGWTKLYGVQSHKITVKRDRDPRAIAGEITRRLLPAFLPELADVTERLQRDRIATVQRHTVRDAIIARNNGVRWLDHLERDSQTSLGLHLADGYGDVELSNNGTSASVKLHGLPIDLARQVLDLVCGVKA